MRFKPEAEHGANNGLVSFLPTSICLISADPSQSTAREHMEKIKQQFPWISYGDLWTLGGVVAVQESGGPTVPWRPGRIDGFAHIRFIFYRMG